MQSVDENLITVVVFKGRDVPSAISPAKLAEEVSRSLFRGAALYTAPSHQVCHDCSKRHKLGYMGLHLGETSNTGSCPCRTDSKYHAPPSILHRLSPTLPLNPFPSAPPKQVLLQVHPPQGVFQGSYAPGDGTLGVARGVIAVGAPFGDFGEQGDPDPTYFDMDHQTAG
jgi:hypothetical protein